MIDSSAAEPDALKDRLLHAARAAGFADCGCALARPLPEEEARLRAWLAAGRHGEMAWLARQPGKRATPPAWAKTVIMCAFAYPPLVFPEGAKRHAAYLEGGDYHVRLEAMLAEALRPLLAAGFRSWNFVDSRPVLERAWAREAGLGFIGRQHALISRTHGPFVLLAGAYTDAALPPDSPGPDECGDCRLCLAACPTGALTETGFEARRCRAYLTRELRRPLTSEERALCGEWECGCDECLSACPFAARSLPAVAAALDWPPPARR